jgi:hypothetical protein
MKETYGEICSWSAPSLGSLFDNFRTLFKKILHKKIYTVCKEFGIFPVLVPDSGSRKYIYGKFRHLFLLIMNTGTKQNLSSGTMNEC